MNAMKNSGLTRLAVTLLFGLFALFLVFALPLLAQTAAPSVPMSAPAKAVTVVLAVAAILQTVKTVLNKVFPNLVKGRVAVAFTLAASVAAAFATVDPSAVTWQSILLTLFGASGVFSTVQALVKGQS
jgi:hypothetical protein